MLHRAAAQMLQAGLHIQHGHIGFSQHVLVIPRAAACAVQRHPLPASSSTTPITSNRRRPARSRHKCG